MNEVKSRCYVVLRKDLNMPVGKLAVQVGHAVDSIWSHFISTQDENLKQRFSSWVHDGRKKVVLRAKDANELSKLKNKVESSGYQVYDIEDYGMNFFDGLTCTGFVLFPVQDEVKDLKRVRVYE